MASLAGGSRIFVGDKEVQIEDELEREQFESEVSFAASEMAEPLGNSAPVNVVVPPGPGAAAAAGAGLEPFQRSSASSAGDLQGIPTCCVCSKCVPTVCTYSFCRKVSEFLTTFSSLKQVSN